MNKLSQKDVEQVRKEVDEMETEKNKPSKEQVELARKIFEEAKMPIKMKDDKFTLGDKELDIRGLSSANREQMKFRAQVLNNVYLRQINDNLLDTERLLMITLKKLGVEDITLAMEELFSDLQKQVEKK